MTKHVLDHHFFNSSSMTIISEPLSSHDVMLATWHRQDVTELNWDQHHRRKEASARVKSSLFFIIFQRPDMHSVCFFFFFSSFLQHWESALLREGDSVTIVLCIPLTHLSLILLFRLSVSWQVHFAIHIWSSLSVHSCSLACYLRYILHYDYHHSTILIMSTW